IATKSAPGKSRPGNPTARPRWREKGCVVYRMLHRYWFCAAVLTISSVLMAGCASRSNAARRSANKSDTASAAVTSTSNSPADESEAKAAQAHAHYAAGIVHDMNDETDAALRDYYAAATNDPENERLVLEVSRRFLQNKQPEK